jgi:TonB family protein
LYDVEANMPIYSRLAVLLLLALSVAMVGQTNSTTEPTSDKTTAPAEPKTIDGQPVYKPGHGVAPPSVKYRIEPEYSKEARKAKYQGTCLLWLIVDADGNARDIKVTRALGKGLDEKAVEAVEKWKFEPAKKDGQAVAVEINVEVTFHIQ